MESKPTKPESKFTLLGCCAISLVLLIVFGYMQAKGSKVMDLKAQWLWIAVLPILVFIITGKYIGRFKGAGIEIEQFKTEPEMRLLPYASPQILPASLEAQRPDEKPASVFSSPAPASTPWTAERESEYKRTGRLFLVHVYDPSTRPGQKYDITIFLMRHKLGLSPNQKEDFSEVEKLEVYLGASWNDMIFTAPNSGGLIGIRTSAFGSFLATGRVVFKDGRPPLILQRFIDFEMAPNKIQAADI
jgi:hypothetical protein